MQKGSLTLPLLEEVNCGFSILENRFVFARNDIIQTLKQHVNFTIYSNYVLIPVVG